MVVTPVRHAYDEAENEFSMYTTTSNREYNQKSGFHVSLATSKGIGPRPPKGKLLKMRETAPKDRTEQYSVDGVKGGPSMSMKIAKMLAGRKKVGTAHTGGVSQIFFTEEPHSAAQQRKKKPMTNPPQGFRSGNGSFLNTRPSTVLGGDASRSYETESKAAYRMPSPMKDSVRFNLYLVRDECHVGGEPHVVDPPLNAWQSKRLKKTDPLFTHQGDSRFTTISNTAHHPPRPHSAADYSELIAAKMSQNPSARHLDLRSKLAFLSGRSHRTRPQTSFSRTAPGGCDPENSERVANPMTVLGGRQPGPTTRLETEGQQRASMSHSLHTAQAKGNVLFGSSGRRLVKNPPYCRDGVHPPENTDLRVDGTLPECAPPGSPNKKIWGHMLESEKRGFGGQPAMGFAHKLRSQVKHTV